MSNTFDKRRAYLGLTTDEFYGASNFYHWVHDTAMGIIAQPVLCGANLLLNGEINDWLDFTTFLQNNHYEQYFGIEHKAHQMYIQTHEL